MLGGQLEFELCAGLLVGGLGEAAAVQHAHRSDRAHDCHLGAGPGVDTGGAE